MSSRGISWAICKSAPCSRQITTPAPHRSVFYRPDALPSTQPTASKHWRENVNHLTNSLHILLVLSLATANNYTALSWHRTITNKVQKRHCASNNLLYCTQTANISKTKLTKILTFSKAPSRRHSFRCRANFSTNYQHNTHTHPFNGPFSGTTQVSRYQKGKTNLDFTGARDSE